MRGFYDKRHLPVDEDEEKRKKRVEKKLNEISSIVEADAVVDPWTVMVHIQNTVKRKCRTDTRRRETSQSARKCTYTPGRRPRR